MSLQNVENLENNTAKLTIEVSAEELEKALESAYQKQKNKINVPGFRKGKVPRNMVEKLYGAGIFYEDAANALIPAAYADAATESKLEIVANPDIDVVQIEKGKPFIFTAEVVLKPEVELGQYKDIEVAKKEIEVTDAEVDAEVDKVREQNARLVTVEDRGVEVGDNTVIDFEGFVDGEAFEGGKGTDYPLTIGSHSFIDTFEDQLVGKNIGEEVEVNVTFPEEYHAEELKGKPAMFKVTVKEIKKKELPEVDDDFAQDVSEFDTLAEYKEDLKKQLADKKTQEAKTEKENEVIGKIIENAKMEIPQKMIDAQVQNMVRDFAQRIQAQGLTMEQYLQFTGMTPDKLMEQMQPQAKQRIESRLVLEAVAKAEAITVSDEEYEGEIEKMASMYQMEKDKLMEMIGETEKENITSDIAVQKAVDLVVESAKEA
jgi:trigger factor